MRRFFVLTILLASLIFVGAVGFAAESSVQYNTDYVNAGVIQVKLDETYAEDTIKVMVAYEGKNPQFYDYNRFEDFEAFPVAAGEGTYQIGVYQLVSGKSYQSIDSKRVVIDEIDPLAPYLTSIHNIRWEQGDQATSIAAELTKDAETDWEKVEILHQYIIESITYDYDKAKNVAYGYLPDNDATLASKDGICYDYSSLMASMLRSLNIPTKLVMGYAESSSVYHAWNEVYNRETGEWLVIDTTHDAAAYQHDYPFSMIKDSASYDVKKVY